MRVVVILWLAGVSCLVAANPFSTQTWDTESGLPQNTVQGIAQTRDGYLWFATEGGLARFDTQRFAIFNSKNTPQIRSNDVRGVLEDKAGRLWMATADGVTVLGEGKFSSFTTDQGLPSNSTSAVFSDAGHDVCAATAGGVACLEKGRFVAKSGLTEPEMMSGNTEAMRPYVASPVLCSFVDREGNTWLGTEASGVTVLRRQPFESFSDRAAGLDDQVRCVYRDRRDVLWLGTNAHGLIKYTNGEFQRITAKQGLSSNVIVSLGEDANGDLLVGTPDGLNRMHDGRVKVMTSSDGLPDDFVRSIHTDADGTVWIGTRRGLSRISDGHFQTFTHADGLGSDLIGSLVRDAAGRLWIATLGGLSEYDGTRFANFTTANGLSSNVITALHVDAKGVLWVGTQGGGLNRYLNGVMQPVNVPGVPEVIYGIAEDLQGKLWLASDSGIVRFDRGEAVSYGVSDGLRVNECSGGGHPTVANGKDGGIWFATLKGVSLLRTRAHFNEMPPPVVIESVAIDNRVLEGQREIDVAPGSNRLVFSYAALSYSAPQKTTFQYRLEGFDKNWVDAGNSRTAFYTNLGPGHYTFHVIARNGDGIWNKQGATAGIHMLPHFYQTWWFAALMLLPIAGASYGVYRWRVARVEAAMASRFEAVLGERNRIAREIHDTLAQGFAGISVQLEIVSRKLESSGETARQHLDTARMLVRSSLAEARRSIWELRSQGVESGDLPSRLSQMTTQMGGSGRPKIVLEVHGSYRALGGKTEDELLRMAQEAMTNAIKHAEATQIDVELAFDPKLLRMTISDNGKGFTASGDTGGVNGHFGLKGIGERAAGIGAKLKLESAPGAGTRVSVEVAV